MATKYYAVRVGAKTGIFNTWDECKAVTRGYPAAQYKSFIKLEDARKFLDNNEIADANDNVSDIYAFVDGSFNSSTGVYGYGGFVFYNGNKEILQGSGSDSDMASMRNVAGEILGSMAAIKKAYELGLKEITVYYDYLGIEMWATGGWKRNKKGTIAYYEFIQSMKDKISINFIKVKGHSGVEGNEEADILAKKAVGIL